MRSYIYNRNSVIGSQAEHCGMRTYFFSADTQEDMNGWIRAMNQAALMQQSHAVKRLVSLHEVGLTSSVAGTWRKSSLYIIYWGTYIKNSLELLCRRCLFCLICSCSIFNSISSFPAGSTPSVCSGTIRCCQLCVRACVCARVRMCLCAHRQRIELQLLLNKCRNYYGEEYKSQSLMPIWYRSCLYLMGLEGRWFGAGILVSMVNTFKTAFEVMQRGVWMCCAIMLPRGCCESALLNF